MNLFLVSFSAGASFLLSFLLFFHPFHQNIKANRWLSFFVFVLGCAFICSYLIQTESPETRGFLFKNLNGLQFLLGPGLFMGILFFVQPKKTFKHRDLLHFLPFFAYTLVENSGLMGNRSISTIKLFAVNSNVSFLLRDLLPFITLLYVFASYLALNRHRANLKLISSNIDRIDLDWLQQAVYLLAIAVFIWLNDALFELPYISDATSWLYAGLVFFFAYFSIRQKAVFDFKEKDITAISELIAEEPGPVMPALQNGKSRPNRLSDQQITRLSEQLYALMEQDRMFLNNDLNLPMVAEKLDIGIHETSFLINAAAKDNFYNFINKFRVEEAKRLLESAKFEEWNILGIAFASGFNSKTTFNTTFKKIVGVSPSQYAKAQKSGEK